MLGWKDAILKLYKMASYLISIKMMRFDRVSFTPRLLPVIELSCPEEEHIRPVSTKLNIYNR